MNSVQKIVLGVGLLIVAIVLHRSCYGWVGWDFYSAGGRVISPWAYYSDSYALVVGMAIPLLLLTAGLVAFAGFIHPKNP